MSIPEHDLPDDVDADVDADEPTRAEELDLPPEAEDELDDEPDEPAPGLPGWTRTSD